MNEEHTRAELERKLHPGRFPGMSPKMAAIVGYILGQSYTDPGIAELYVDEGSGAVFARNTQDIGFNDYIGALSDLSRNWVNLMDCADLTPEERTLAGALYGERIEEGAIA